MNRLAAPLVTGAVLAAALGSLVPFSHATRAAEPSAAPPIGADETPGSITVRGSASIVLVPDRARVAIRVGSLAPSIEQALTEFEGQRTMFDKVAADFADLGATVTASGVELGMRVNQNQVFRNGELVEPESPFEVREIVTLDFSIAADRAKAIRDIAALVSAAGEVDARLDGPDANNRVYYSNREDQPPGPISFTVSDEAYLAAEEAATRLAFDDAKARALRLAALAGGNLGKVHSISIVKMPQRTLRSSGEDQRTLELSVVFGLLE